jgi:hypothetical protein
MPLLSIVVGVVLLLGLVLAIGWAVLSFKFQHRPEKQWKDRACAALARAQTCCAELSSALVNLDRQWQDERRHLPGQHFAQMLAATAIDELEEFPGIGPATVDRLRHAGHGNMAQLLRVDLHAIDGLDKRRLADVEQARKTLLQQLRQRIDHGDCPEAQTLAATLAQRQRDMDRQKQVASARLQAAERTRAELQSLVNQAALVTFPAYLMGGGAPLLPPVLVQAAIPDVDAAMAAAEKEAAPAPPVSATPAAAPPVPAAPAVANQPQQLLDLTVQFAFVVARCDGRLARKEKEWIAGHFGQRYRDDAAMLDRARALCAHYETTVPNAEACLDEINARFPTDQKAALMEMAHGIAAAAGDINQKEVKFLHKLSQRLGVPEPAALRQPAPPPTSPAVVAPPPVAAASPPQQAAARGPEQQLALLEIAPGTPLSADLVRRQYTRLVEKFAPDKMQHMGPEFVAAAQQKRQLIEQAARALMAPFKEELIPTAAPPAPKDLRHNPDLDALFGG